MPYATISPSVNEYASNPEGSPLAGMRCPECRETQRFILQVTINTVVEPDGYDYGFNHCVPADQFPGRVIPEDDGLTDTDPIQCFSRYNVCRHQGTVAEFREVNQH